MLAWVRALQRALTVSQPRALHSWASLSVVLPLLVVDWSLGTMVTVTWQQQAETVSRTVPREEVAGLPGHHHRHGARHPRRKNPRRPLQRFWVRVRERRKSTAQDPPAGHTCVDVSDYAVRARNIWQLAIETATRKCNSEQH